ncbi:hypothetical protein CRG98_007759 [Punica granatum]|uniref:Uncharacterized protein n=1 Tax=Punica granatum TaxID=22663 RepID=A0A2I0KU28_PUNGR|nr:hypothetical protein CRG98_007759 [Punica granatum]
MWTLVGARICAFGSRGLGVSTFPWGRMTDTRERMSRHLSFYDSLGIRGKSRGSVRESGDSVEHLEGCSSAKDAHSGKEACAGHGSTRGALDARARGSGCTVHPRPRPSPEIT